MIPPHLTVQQMHRAHIIAQNPMVADAVIRLIRRRRRWAVLQPIRLIGWWLGVPALVIGFARTGVGEQTSPVAWIGLTLVYMAIISGAVQNLTVYPAALQVLHGIDVIRRAGTPGRLDRQRVATALIRVTNIVATSIPLGRWTPIFGFHDRVIYAERRQIRLALMSRVEASIVDPQIDWARLEDDVWRLLFRIHAEDWFRIRDLGATGIPRVKVRWRENIDWQKILSWMVGLATITGVVLTILR